MQTNSAGHSWSSRFVFIMAAAGAAVGLGNIWKFPYTAGVNGGGAFVLIYLIAVAVISFPVLLTELTIGRRGRSSDPVSSLENVARESHASPIWRFSVFIGVLASIFALSFYFVITGWIGYYAVSLSTQSFSGLNSTEVVELFDETSSNGGLSFIWQTGMIVMVGAVAVLGVRQGVEKIAKYLMPLLFFLLIANVVLAATLGDFGSAFVFLFNFDLSSVTINTVYYAVGQAFFTVGAGSCVMIVFGAHVPRSDDLIGSAFRVTLLDTSVALLAGLAVFPLVFSNNLSPGEGAGLLFITMTSIFAEIPFGSILGGLFFLMVALAAITSAIAIVLPPIEVLQRRMRTGRLTATIIILGIIWALGLGVVCSFGSCSAVRPLAFVPAFSDLNIFEAFEVVSIQICLPLGALFLTLFMGWCVKREVLIDELGHHRASFIDAWRFLLRYILPVLISVVLFSGLFGG